MNVSSPKPRPKKGLITEVYDTYFTLEEPLKSNQTGLEKEKIDLDQLLQKLATEYDAIGWK